MIRVAKGKPRIAVNCDVAGDTRKRATLPLDYLDAIVRHGGLPIPIAPVLASVALLQSVDGVLFIGGDDYAKGNHEGEPADYTAVDPRREQVDFALAQRAQELDLPVLGICCGFQLLVLNEGGRIHGDIPTEAPSDVRHKRPASVENGSPLVHHDIEWIESWNGVPKRQLTRVNSHHHQGVSRLPTSWRTLAQAADGVVEAARGPGRFQLGIQWHPEKELEDPLNAQIFRAFIEASSQ